VTVLGSAQLLASLVSCDAATVRRSITSVLAPQALFGCDRPFVPALEATPGQQHVRPFDLSLDVHCACGLALRTLARQTKRESLMNHHPSIPQGGGGSGNVPSNIDARPTERDARDARA
jgi:hypothetical protein